MRHSAKAFFEIEIKQDEISVHASYKLVNFAVYTRDVGDYLVCINNLSWLSDAQRYLTMNLGNMTSKTHLGKTLFGVHEIQRTVVAKKTCNLTFSDYILTYGIKRIRVKTISAKRYLTRNQQINQSVGKTMNAISENEKMETNIIIYYDKQCLTMPLVLWLL